MIQVQTAKRQDQQISRCEHHKIILWSFYTDDLAEPELDLKYAVLEVLNDVVLRVRLLIVQMVRCTLFT